jgi:hypothetical protein
LLRAIHWSLAFGVFLAGARTEISTMNENVGSDLGSQARSNGDGKDTAQQVKDAVRDTVRDTTKQVASAAKEQARTTYEQKKNLVLDEVGSLASALRDVGNNLKAQNDGSIAAQFTARVADRLEAVGDHLTGKDLDGIIRDVEGFGRRNPAVFLGTAAALGFLAIRFVKSSARPNSDELSKPSGPRSDKAAGRSQFVSYGEDS